MILTINVKCLYCGSEIIKSILSINLSKQVCDKCGDTNIIVKDNKDVEKIDQYKQSDKKLENEKKIDYYIGCPPFPEKEEEAEEKDDDPRDISGEWYF